MCVKNTTYNGCDNGVWSPTNYTTWVVEHVAHLFLANIITEKTQVTLLAKNYNALY